MPPPPPGRKELPSHFTAPMAGDLSEEEEEETPRVGRPCYVFNPILRRNLDDTACEHCRFYLTPRCPHLDEFMEDLDDLTPEG
jgi:hypothetical protein